MSNEEPRTKLVNQSGFPLQIALGSAVAASTKDHGWKVLFTEHAWNNPTAGAHGFLDLVLVDEYGTSFMSIECKRVLDSQWIFLVPEMKPKGRRHANAFVRRTVGNKNLWFGWGHVTVDPTTPESSYCVIRGQDDKDRPLLERIGAQLVSATEAFAQEEQRIVRAANSDEIRFFYNVIVTTAKLSVCRMAPENVSLFDGQVDGVEFADVPYIRFRKQLAARLPDESRTWNSPYELGYAKEHTVFIVNAERFQDFLAGFEIDDKAVGEYSRLPAG